MRTPLRSTGSSALACSNGTTGSPAPRALGSDNDRMQPNTWQGVVRRASLKNRRLGLESDLLAHGVPLGVNLRRTQHEHIFSGLSLSSDAARRSLTVRSGLDFFEPDQGSRPRWAHTAPGRSGHGYG